MCMENYVHVDALIAAGFDPDRIKYGIGFKRFWLKSNGVLAGYYTGDKERVTGIDLMYADFEMVKNLSNSGINYEASGVVAGIPEDRDADYPRGWHVWNKGYAMCTEMLEPLTVDRFNGVKCEHIDALDVNLEVVCTEVTHFGYDVDGNGFPNTLVCKVISIIEPSWLNRFRLEVNYKRP